MNNEDTYKPKLTQIIGEVGKNSIRDMKSVAKGIRNAAHATYDAIREQLPTVLALNTLPYTFLTSNDHIDKGDPRIVTLGHLGALVGIVAQAIVLRNLTGYMAIDPNTETNPEWLLIPVATNLIDYAQRNFRKSRKNLIKKSKKR